MSVGSTMEYGQRKFPASGVTVTETGMIPARAGAELTATAATAATNRRAIQVRRIMRSILRERRLVRPIPRLAAAGLGRPPLPSVRSARAPSVDTGGL